jgi:hypothetical protein
MLPHRSALWVDPVPATQRCLWPQYRVMKGGHGTLTAKTGRIKGCENSKYCWNWPLILCLSCELVCRCRVPFHKKSGMIAVGQQNVWLEYKWHWMLQHDRCCPQNSSIWPHVPSGLTVNNSTFYPHSVIMCFVWIWVKTAVLSPHNIKWLVFITQI